MGSYKEIKGDLLALAKEGKFDVIAHGCNCYKTMGAGIALSIRNQFPEAHKKDSMDSRTSFQRYGDLTYVLDLKSDTYIVNLYTQYLPGAHFNYTAFECTLLKLTLKFSEENKIGLPMIGCGIGGGNWEKIKEVIQRVLSDYDVTVVIYDK